MSTALNIMTDDEVRRCRPDQDEAGFGALSTERGPLPLKAMEISARIDGLVAHTVLTQSFVNTIGQPLEATYIFPLPDRAAVTGFRMEVAGRIVDGVIKERGEARRTYEQAIQSGHRAAITEEERPGVFTLRAGNIMPGETAKIRLTLTGPLPYDEGEVTYRFPLVVAPRYIPGAALGGENVGDGVADDTDQVPDASRITPPVLLPGYPNPVRLGLEVELAPGNLPLGQLRSSLHAITEGRSEDGRIRLRIQPGERLNRDFILRYGVGENAVRTSLEIHPDASGEGGTFLLSLIPPVNLSRSTKARDVVFILDRSGSMEGWKMVAARRAVARMVDTLTEKDRFQVYAFDDRIETPDALRGDAPSAFGLVPASDRNRFRAVEFLAKLDARGGTEMREPLERAAAELAGGYEDRERVIFLVTDGQVGNEDHILRSLVAKLKNVRIFTLGVDRAVNEGFLKRLATAGGGLTELVESEDRLDEVMGKIHRRIGLPVLSETTLIPQGLLVEQDTVVPRRLPDLFAGAPLFVMGRYRGASAGAVSVAGRDAAGRSWSEKVEARTSPNAAIPSLWARGQVRELEDRFVMRDGNVKALEKQIVETSLRYGVLCRFTAFVAVDEAEKVNPGGRQHQMVQPVEAPEGWEMLRSRSPVPMAASRGMPLPSPAAAPAPLRAKASAPPPAAYEAAFGAPEELEYADEDGAMYDAMATGDLAAPAAPPPPPAGLAKRMKKALGGMIGGGRGQSAPAKREEAESARKGAPAADTLEAYRRRAAELAARLEEALASAQTPDDRQVALGMLSVQLRTLLEDLRSVGAPRAALQPLEALLGQLEQVVSASAPGAAELDAAQEAAKTALEAFGSGGGGRREFWK